MAILFLYLGKISNFMADLVLLEKLKRVEEIASLSKFRRMMVCPFKYFNAILFRELIYKRSRVEKEVLSKTFFGATMHLLIPASTDIYLTGGKSHDSEIRLAKFLINRLNTGDTFLDVGAHYGYYTLLSSTLVGEAGQVHAFEASPTTYNILKKNTENIANIDIHNLAVSDEIAELKFYEFPNLYSEYNTLDKEQFEKEEWFFKYNPKQINIKSIILDEYLSSRGLTPNIIKIDVEGAENKVINGLRKHLTENSPMIAMEYLSDERGNKGHQGAEKTLNSLGYKSFVIDDTGNLKQIEQISEYLHKRSLESDNIVFVNG